MFLMGLAPLLYWAGVIPLRSGSKEVLSNLVVAGRPVAGPNSSATSYVTVIYRLAVNRFPTLEHCVVVRPPEEKTIVWKRIKTKAQAEVCLWHLAHSFQNPGQFLGWWEQQQVSAYLSDNRGKWPTEREPTLNINLTKVDRERVGAFSHGIFRLLGRGDSIGTISVSYDRAHQVDSVQIQFIWW